MIIEIILLAILLIIIIFLFLGVKIVGNFAKKESKLTINIKLLIFTRFKIYKLEYPKENKVEKQDDKKSRNLSNFDEIRPCIDPILIFAKSLFKSLNIEKLKIHIDLGLSSYVSTAKYVGYLWAFFVLPNSYLKNTCMTATPHFGKSIIDFKGELDVKINLLKILIPLLKLISNKNVLKLIREVIR